MVASTTAGVQGESINSSADTATHLDQLQQWLQAICGRSSSAALLSPATADTQLTQLRRSAAALKHAQQQQQQLADSSEAAAAAAVRCMELLTQELLAPSPELYSGLSGSPSQPAEGLELAGEQQLLLAAAQLELLLLLLRLFTELPVPPAADEQQGGQAADAGGARNKPSYFEGIVEIIELADADVAGGTASLSQKQQQQQHLEALQQQVVQALLAAALYAADSSTQQPPCASAGCEEPDGAASSLSCVCDSIVQQGLRLNTPWSCCQLQAAQLLQLVLCSIILPSGSSSRSKGLASGASSSAASAPSSTEEPSSQQEQQEQVAWCHMLPLLLGQLRDTLLAQHRHRKLQDRGGDMVAYTGPPTFARCLAARQLAWLVQQLQPSSLADPQTLGLLLPLVLAVADDPSPCVRQYGHAALGWVGLRAPAAGLRWQGELLREEARRLVVGCEESCWSTAMPAATSLVLALEGKDQRSPAYHSLVLVLLQEADRSAHKPQPRMVFMCCLARLVPPLGLYVVRHFAALMPLLLEWVHAYDADSSVLALQLLGLLAQHSWPRMGAHAAVIRQHVQQVLRQEQVERGPRRATSQQQQQQMPEAMGGAVVVDSRRYAAGSALLAVLDRCVAVADGGPEAAAATD